MDRGRAPRDERRELPLTDPEKGFVYLEHVNMVVKERVKIELS